MDCLIYTKYIFTYQPGRVKGLLHLYFIAPEVIHQIFFLAPKITLQGFSVKVIIEFFMFRYCDATDIFAKQRNEQISTVS